MFGGFVAVLREWEMKGETWRGTHARVGLIVGEIVY